MEEQSSSESSISTKVAEVCSKIEKAKQVGEVIVSLHSLAILLFDVDSPRLAGCLDDKFKSEVLHSTFSADPRRELWCRNFYHGASFPTFSKILLYDVALSWLESFPLTARELVYDSYFINAPSSEAFQALYPGLTNKVIGLDSGSANHTTIHSNLQRLLVVCLVDYHGVQKMIQEFSFSPIMGGHAHGSDKSCDLSFQSNVAQMVAALPDRVKVQEGLSAPYFFKQVVVQILAEVDKWAAEYYQKQNELDIRDCFFFIGKLMCHICRRGSAGILVSEMAICILADARKQLSADADSKHIMWSFKSEMWQSIIEAMKDLFAVERLSEELLRHMSRERTSDIEACSVLRMLFGQSLKHGTPTRFMFVDKFLFRKVFPVCCLKWIISYAIYEHPPSSPENNEIRYSISSLDVVKKLVSLWSNQGFVQSASIDQQAYITAAVGLTVERMTREEIESTDGLLHSLLQGVSCRLESPDHLVRRMASSIALIFSKVVDKNNLLYLDDCCIKDTINWEFGSGDKTLESTDQSETLKHLDDESSHLVQDKSIKPAAFRKGDKTTNKVLSGISKKFPKISLVDPDETDLIPFNNEDSSDQADSDALSESSLQPYDMSDNDTDLKRKYSQLADILGAIRKSDNPEGVEEALDVAETLIRAVPDELQYLAKDLVRVLVHMRCSDIAVEGEEDSTEQKRQKAIIALLVTCPFECLDVLAKSFYSPSLDVSQRIMILDVLTGGAVELANAKSSISTNEGNRGLISFCDSEKQPWYIPSSRGITSAGPWKEVPERELPLNWSYKYERELPTKSTKHKEGKSRRWHEQSARATEGGKLTELRNKFPLYAAAFTLPFMQSYDKRMHGVDLLGRDFVVLGKLIHMLGVCMKCLALHPEASALAPAILDMISSRSISCHAEAYVRRTTLFAASCLLQSLHPSHVASSMIQGNQELSRGLDWIRSWAIQIAETDTDTECSSLAMACLQLHSEMALQASRSIESADYLQVQGVTSIAKGLIRFR